MSKNSKNESRDYLLPSQVRIFAETVAGKKEPITEKDFSESELKQMRDAIARQRNQLARANDAKRRGYAYPEVPKNSVGYQDYSDDPYSTKRAARDYSPLPQDAARNTLGRFRYEKTPEGRLVAIDSYDFKDDLVDKLPNIPKSKDYEKLNNFEKLKKLAADTLANDKGGFSTLPSRVGSAFIGARSRPVRVDLGEAPFKKGGLVKTKKAVSVRSNTRRGDGIVTKGFTKGKIR